jgi:hypothetical protein
MNGKPAIISFKNQVYLMVKEPSHTNLKPTPYCPHPAQQAALPHFAGQHNLHYLEENSTKV